MVLFNLKATKYNGLKGTLLSFYDGRWLVQVEGYDIPKRFKVENLKYSNDDDDDYIVISSDEEEEDDNDRRRKRPRLSRDNNNIVEATCEAWVDPSQTPETPGHVVVSSSSEGTETSV